MREEEEAEKLHASSKGHRSPLLGFFLYCAASILIVGALISMFAGCAMQPATTADLANGTEYLEEEEEVDVSTPVNPFSSIVDIEVEQEKTTLPGIPVEHAPIVDAIPERGDDPGPVTLDDTCRCEWRTWSDDNGLMCAGIRCNDACDADARSCVERHACVIMGI